MFGQLAVPVRGGGEQAAILEAEHAEANSRCPCAAAAEGQADLATPQRAARRRKQISPRRNARPGAAASHCQITITVRSGGR
ncbi:MAG: hypothetical protein IPI49_05085 [Myxococcales bacterium]|nr:hypothetical protein [Myxococcales bacterium]